MLERPDRQGSWRARPRSLESVSWSAYDGAPRRDKWAIPDQLLWSAREKALLQEVRSTYKGAMVSGRDLNVYCR